MCKKIVFLLYQVLYFVCFNMVVVNAPIENLLANLVLYKNNKIASWENCSLGSDRLIKKISLSGVIYNVPEIYGLFLDNLNAYEHYESV